MSNTMTLIGILAILVFCSSFFSATETAYSSINKIKLKNMASAGSRKAQKALELADDPGRQQRGQYSGFVVGDGFVRAEFGLRRCRSQSVDGGHDDRDLNFRRNFTEKHREGNAGEVCDGGCGRDWFYPNALNPDQLSVQFVEEAAFDDVQS